MYKPVGVKTSSELPVPEQMKAWVLGNPDQLFLREKSTPVPGRAEVLVRIDAVAICATDLEIIHSGSPASIEGGLPLFPSLCGSNPASTRSCDADITLILSNTASTSTFPW